MSEGHRLAGAATSVYARTWHYHNSQTDVTQLPLEVRSDLAVAERVVGQVLGARLVRGLCSDESGRHGNVTTLIVAVEPEG